MLAVRRWLARLCLVVAVLALAYAAWESHPQAALGAAQNGMQATALAALALALGRVLHGPAWAAPGGSLVADLPPEAPPRWRALALGLAALCLLISANIGPGLHFTPPLANSVQVGLWLLGMGLSLWALSQGWRLRPAWVDGLHLSGHGLALAAVLLLALLLRTWQLAEGVPRLIDEVHMLSAVVLLDDQAQPLLLPHNGTTYFTWFYPLLQWATTSLLGPSLFSIRIVSALFGLAQVGLLYGLVRLLHGRRVALLAALLLATWPQHIHWSRIGLHNNADPTLALLALILLVLALRSGRRGWWVGAGLALGCTYYFYEVGRLFYTPLLLAWLLWMGLFAPQVGWLAQAWAWWVHKPPPVLRLGGWRPLLPREAAWLLAGLALAALPMLYAWTANDLSLAARLQTSGRGAAGLSQSLYELSQTLSSAWLAYVHLPDGSTFYNGVGGLVWWPLVAAFLGGVAWCAARLRQGGAALWLLWVGGVALANGLFSIGIHSPRYVVALPALAALTALGLAHLGRLLLGRWPALLHGLALLAAGGQAVYYFGFHLPNYYTWVFSHEKDVTNQALTSDFDDMLFRAVRLPYGTDVYVVARGFTGGSGYGVVLAYYDRTEADDLRMNYLYREALTDTLIGSMTRTRHNAFFLDADDTSSLALLSNYFVLDGPYFSTANIPRERQFVLYLAPLNLENINHPSLWGR